MKNVALSLGLCLSFILSAAGHASPSENQTPTVSPIFPEDTLPFRIEIELADFSLPNGIHSNVFATHEGKWLLLAGRTNGLHGFENNDNNFPPQSQNTTVYVVDPDHKKVYSRSLNDERSGLSQRQIDSLSVTSPQFYQKGDKLFITGGYGIDTRSNTFGTKDVLTEIDVDALMRWVMHPHTHNKAVDYIRQIKHPIFQVTGGYMNELSNGMTLLVFGQNFIGYYTDGSNGEYTEQVRRFKIHSDHGPLRVDILDSLPNPQDPSYRRRDLNVVPIVDFHGPFMKPSLVALSGVFTLAGGIWTVPVEITRHGKAFMADPLLESTFKQGMNNYVSATMQMFSKHHDEMYIVLFGGISYGYFEGNTFLTDPEIPFINQVTTVKIDKHKNFTQYLMNAEYPVILSTASNPGNQLLFGAGSNFIQKSHVSSYIDEVFKFDHLSHKNECVGYIVGGIQSTLPNTNTQSDSAASPYIFKVMIKRVESSSSVAPI